MRLRRTLTTSERDQLGRYALRLFASIDLEGSTVFKQSRDARPGQTPWLNVVHEFVQGFDADYWRHIGQVARAKGFVEPPPQPSIWKILGDELVFSMELKSAAQASVYVDALTQAVAEWNREVLATRKKSTTSDRPLLVKAAAWLADFPVTNAVLPVTDGHEDYVGPAMDAGFRLCKLSSPRRLAIGVELAWLLLRHDSRRVIEFAGRTRELKGVAGESGYPQLWIEVPASAYHAKEHAALGPRRHHIPATELRDLCAAFIADFGVPPNTPHLPGEADCPPPSDHPAALQRVRADLATRYPLDESLSSASPARAAVTGSLLFDALLAGLTPFSQTALATKGQPASKSALTSTSTASVAKSQPAKRPTKPDR
jgi:hypothetical protein